MHTSRRLIVDVVAVGLSLRPCQGAGCDLREEYETIESFSSGFGWGNRGGGKSGEQGEGRRGNSELVVCVCYLGGGDRVRGQGRGKQLPALSGGSIINFVVVEGRRV